MKTLITATILALLTTPATAFRYSDNPEIRQASEKLKSCVSSLPAQYKKDLTRDFKAKNPDRRLPRFLRSLDSPADKAQRSKDRAQRSKDRANNPKHIKRLKNAKKHKKRNPKRILKRLDFLTQACLNKTLHKMKFTRHKKSDRAKHNKRPERKK
jgi:hypothetical protein